MICFASGVVVYFRKQPLRLLLAVFVFLAAFFCTRASQFFDYKIIAQTSPGASIGGYTPISFSSPTINDSGHLAFAASVQGNGSAVVRWNGTQNEALRVSFNGAYGSAAIDDSDRVATCFSATAGGNS